MAGDYLTPLLVNAPNLVGIFLPFLVEFINKDIVSKKWQHIVSVVVCLLVAGLLHGREFSLSDPYTFLGWVGIIFIESQSVFTLYFKNSSLRSYIKGEGSPEIDTSSLPIDLQP